MTSLSKKLTCIPTTRTVQIMSAWHSPPPGTRMFLVHRTCPGETTSRQTRESSLPAMRKAQAFAVPTQTPAQCPLHRCLHHLHTRRYSTRLYRRHTPIGQHTTVLFHLPAHCDITAPNTLKAGALTKKHRCLTRLHLRHVCPHPTLSLRIDQGIPSTRCRMIAQCFLVRARHRLRCRLNRVSSTVIASRPPCLLQVSNQCHEKSTPCSRLKAIVGASIV